MKDKLVLDQPSDFWRISWEVVVDGSYDIGATLGEGSPEDWEGDPPKSDEREEWEHWAAQKAASTSRGVERDGNGFFWESEKDARAAMRIVKEACKQERPMPEWATKALAAGWKPPKGWKAP